MKKILLSLIIIISLFTLTGCGNEREQKKPIDPVKQMWMDAEKDEVYKSRLFIREPINSLLYEQIGKPTFNKRLDEFKKIETNQFIKELLTKYNNSELNEVLENGNHLELTILYSYLMMRTGRYEGIGHPGTSGDTYFTFDTFTPKISSTWEEQFAMLTIDGEGNIISEESKLEKIYYVGFDENGNFIESKYTKDANVKLLYVFNDFVGEGNPTYKNYSYVLVELGLPSGYYENKETHSISSGGIKIQIYHDNAILYDVIREMNKNLSSEVIVQLFMAPEIQENVTSIMSHETILNVYFEKNETPMVLELEKMNHIINNNIEFLDMYLKYKNDIFYPRRDKERKEKDVQVGMDMYEVYSATTWGVPKSVATYGNGSYGWTYKNGGALTIENGVVSRIYKPY